jgi:hypothetical protein
MSSAEFESAEVAKIARNVEVFQEQAVKFAIKVSIVLLGNRLVKKLSPRTLSLLSLHLKKPVFGGKFKFQVSHN